MGWPPDLLKGVVKGGIVLIELRTNERIKIVMIEVCLGSLSKILLMVGGAVVPDGPTRVEQNPLIRSLLHGLIIGIHDRLVIKTQNLIVVGMGQFVENHRRVLK